MTMKTRLVHVSTEQSLAQRTFPGEDAPEWAPSEDEEFNGTVGLRRWDENHVMVRVRLKASGDNHFVAVGIAAMYEVDPEAVKDLKPTGSPPKEWQKFLNDRAVPELSPFLTQAVHHASALVWPMQPILIDPMSLLQR